MRGALTTLTLLLIPWCLLGAGAGPAGAAADGACSVAEARADLAAARRALARAEVRVDEARRVLAATRSYGDRYGASVGRWSRLSRRVGWPWGEFPTLMLVIDRESGGDPHAQNPYSSAAGLLQLMSLHYAGRFDPYDPRANLSYGLKLWRGSGWRAWAL